MTRDRFLVYRYGFFPPLFFFILPLDINVMSVWKVYVLCRQELVLYAFSHPNCWYSHSVMLFSYVVYYHRSRYTIIQLHAFIHLVRASHRNYQTKTSVGMVRNFEVGLGSSVCAPIKWDELCSVWSISFLAICLGKHGFPPLCTADSVQFSGQNTRKSALICTEYGSYYVVTTVSKSLRLQIWHCDFSTVRTNY